jgi:hypothetical protein
MFAMGLRTVTFAVPLTFPAVAVMVAEHDACPVGQVPPLTFPVWPNAPEPDTDATPFAELDQVTARSVNAVLSAARGVAVSVVDPF